MAPLGITAIARRLQTSLRFCSATVSFHYRHLVPSFQVESPNRLDLNRITVWCASRPVRDSEMGASKLLSRIFILSEWLILVIRWTTQACVKVDVWMARPWLLTAREGGLC